MLQPNDAHQCHRRCQTPLQLTCTPPDRETKQDNQFQMSSLVKCLQEPTSWRQQRQGSNINTSLLHFAIAKPGQCNGFIMTVIISLCEENYVTFMCLTWARSDSIQRVSMSSILCCSARNSSPSSGQCPSFSSPFARKTICRRVYLPYEST